MRNIISKFFFTLLVLTMGIGSVWGACATSGTIYKFATKSSLSATSSLTDSPISITTSNYLASFEGSTGASLSAYNNGSKFQIASNGMKLADKSKSYLIINLGECTLKSGDIVKVKVTSQNAVLSTSTSAEDKFLSIAKNSNVQTLVLEADVDASTIYLLATSNGAIVYSLEVIRPYTITLNATENGGVAVDPVKGGSGDKVVLPHAFKEGYKFKGWFTTPTGTIKQQNYYTISGDKEFYAQFEDLLTDGEMFSLSMESSMKPAAQVGLASGKTLDLLTYATIEGGAAILENTTSNNDKGRITTSGEFNFNDDGVLLTLTLDFPLAPGDEITHVGNNYQLCYTTTKSRSTAMSSTSKKYTVTDAADGLKGKSTIYVWRAASSETKVTSITITRPAPSCAVGDPGDINKGTWDGGKLTLTAEGSAADGDTWYWQSAEDGTATNLGSGSTKDITAAGTYYLRSYNTAGTCWSDAKSVTVEASDLLSAPTATFGNGAYTVGASALNLSTLWSSNSDGTVTYALKVASEDATVSGSSFTATKAGSYVVTATQAATASYSGISKEATITVTYPATGSGVVIRYDLDVTNGGSTLQTTKVDAKASTLSVATSTTMLAGGLEKSSSKGTHNGTRTLGINTLAEETSSKYFYVTFSVADDYQFTPTAISLKVLTIGGNATSYKAVLTDGTNSITGTASATNDSELTLGSWDNLGTTALTGDVTLKLYAWYTTSGSYNAYRLSTPITITGDVAAAGACTTPTISWDGDQPENAYTCEGSKTFVMNSNYPAGIAPVLSENTCGATIAVKPETDNKQWVVSFTGAGSVKVTPKVVGDGTTVCAETVSGTAKTLTVTEGYDVIFNMKDHGTQIAKQTIAAGGKATKPSDPTAMGLSFGGWFTDSECTAGNEWDFANDVVTEATELFAKWTAFDGCTELWPATSGDAPTVGDAISMQTGSTGATMTALALGSGTLAYTSAGLQFGSNAGPKVGVVLNNEMQVGTQISLTLVAGGTGTRGLNLYDANGNKINAFTCWVSNATNGAEATYTYTVVAGDGLEGTNEFQLARNNTVYLKALKVTNCGAAVIYHNLTSEVNIAGKGTVSLGASSVREGLTTTTTYSDIDEAYEFVNWTISGAGASIADATANPATITMGTEDAVVTLNLQLKPVYYTVTYKDGESSMGTEEVAENGHPTATGISTAKKGYNFLGWSETDGGAVVELNTITITAATNVYAKYEAIPCPTYGTVFSMSITDPEDTEYNENNEFGLEIGATYTGGKAYSGSKSSTKRIGKIDANGEYSFNANGDVMVKVDLDCSLQEGDVLSFTSTPSRELKIRKVAGTDLYTTSGKSFTIPAESPLIGEYVFYLMRDNSQSTFKTFNVYRPAVLTGVTLNDAVVAIDGKVTPVMTLAPAPDAYISSQVWSIVGEGEGTIANINTSTGEVTGVAIGSVTVKVVLNGSIENTCTVTVIDSYTQVDVSETSEWNFAGGAAAASKISFPSTNDEYLLANISGVNNTPEFNACALVVKGKYVSNSQLQAQTIRFNVTTSGKLTIRFACTSDKGEGNNRELYINGVATGAVTYNGEVTYTQVVPGGEVTIKAIYDDGGTPKEDIMNYKYIKFDVNPDVSDADYIRTTTQGRYGTICLPYDGVMVGATIYEAAYRDLGVQKIFFDEVINGEMEAGKPYLFLPKEGTTQLGVYYTSSAAPVAATHYNGFYGYYDLGHLNDGETAYPYNVQVGEYLVYNNQYVMVNGTNSYLAQFRAYIVMSEMPTQGSAPAPGRRRVAMGYTGTNTATGVEDVQGDNVQCTKVIIDGQLYIIRGEKMYNANGLLVK